MAHSALPHNVKVIQENLHHCRTAAYTIIQLIFRMHIQDAYRAGRSGETFLYNIFVIICVIKIQAKGYTEMLKTGRLKVRAITHTLAGLRLH